jgi:hypothetical protein
VGCAGARPHRHRTIYRGGTLRDAASAAKFPEYGLTSADVRVLLLDGVTTTPDNPDHEYVADIVADEVGDASYARTGCLDHAVRCRGTIK